MYGFGYMLPSLSGSITYRIDDDDEVEEAVPQRYFYRSDACCILHENDDGVWWGYVGLHIDHPCYGRRFVRTPAGAISLLKHPPTITHRMLQQRWWLGFEGGYSKEKTKSKLMAIADAIQTINYVDRKSGGFGLI